VTGIELPNFAHLGLDAWDRDSLAAVESAAGD